MNLVRNHIIYWYRLLDEKHVADTQTSLFDSQMAEAPRRPVRALYPTLWEIAIPIQKNINAALTLPRYNLGRWQGVVLLSRLVFPLCSPHQSLAMPAYIISPYAGDIEANVAFAIRCCRMAIQQGHTPIAVHLLYPQILDDQNPAEREKGLELGLNILRHCAAALYFP